MKLQIHSLHFDARAELKEFINKRLAKLDKIYERIVDGEVILKTRGVEKKTTKIAEIKINLPGNQLFAEKESSSFEAAIDEAAEALRRQLKRYKEKQLDFKS